MIIMNSRYVFPLSEKERTQEIVRLYRSAFDVNDCRSNAATNSLPVAGSPFEKARD